VIDSFRKNLAWIRHENNPVLKPKIGGEFGETICMNPYAEVRDRQIYLYYAADSPSEKIQICLTKSSINDVDGFCKREVIIDNGEAGEFDSKWCVLPNTIMIDGKHHIYYTSNNGIGQGLSGFPGIGCALSRDGKSYTKVSGNPILPPSGILGDPDMIGIAGGSLIKIKQKDNSYIIRYYYTGCPTLGEDYFTDQQKYICCAESNNGTDWQRRGVNMQRDPEHDYEDVAVAGPYVIYDEEIERYRMWYSAIGTRWGYYSICYAESEDGIDWYRGESYGDNLQIGPNLGPVSGLYQEQSWDSQMAAYPSVVKVGGAHRLFYTGNGYGKGGIGTALAAPLRAVSDANGVVRINSEDGYKFTATYPLQMSCSLGVIIPSESQSPKWHGPCPDCGIWREYNLFSTENPCVRVTQLLRHKDYGIELRFTLYNMTGSSISDIEFTQIIECESNTDNLDVEWGSSDISKIGNNVVFGSLAAGETRTLTAKIRLTKRES
jgi:hypothetical protein